MGKGRGHGCLAGEHALRALLARFFGPLAVARPASEPGLTAVDTSACIADQFQHVILYAFGHFVEMRHRHVAAACFWVCVSIRTLPQCFRCESL